MYEWMNTILDCWSVARGMLLLFGVWSRLLIHSYLEPRGDSSVAVFFTLLFGSCNCFIEHCWVWSNFLKIMAEEKAKMEIVTKKDVSEKMENWKSEWMVWWRNLKLGDRKQQKTSRGGGYELNSTSWEWVSVHPLHFLAKGRLGGSVNKFVRGKGRLIGRHNIERKGKFVGRYGCFREKDTEHSFYFIADCYCLLGCKQSLCFVWFIHSFRWY